MNDSQTFGAARASDLLDMARLRSVRAAQGCAQDPDDFKSSRREQIWESALEDIRAHERQDHRLYREAKHLEESCRRVRALHRQLRYHQDYDRCGHTEDQHTICHSADGDPLCEETYTLSDPPLCEECKNEQGEPAPWPCDTVRALDGTS